MMFPNVIKLMISYSTFIDIYAGQVFSLNENFSSDWALNWGMNKH